MAKIKFTKTEMKQQQDALKRYRRFLPTLQLKKQQLQFEMRLADEKLAENERCRLEFMEELDSWVALFGDDVNTNFIGSLIKVERIVSGVTNIAGVSIPVFEKVEFSTVDFDYFVYPSWIIDGVNALNELISLREARKILAEQNRLLAHELRMTTQRVNLFEKVKIPECCDNIRQIRIYLSDAETAGVVRSKIAKRKTQEAAAL